MRSGEASSERKVKRGKKFFKITTSIQCLASMSLYIQRNYFLESHQLTTKYTSKSGTLNSSNWTFFPLADPPTHYLCLTVSSYHCAFFFKHNLKPVPFHWVSFLNGSNYKASTGPKPVCSGTLFSSRHKSQPSLTITNFTKCIINLVKLFL